jgi:4-aminobutyrate aminotransferase-like enzyme
MTSKHQDLMMRRRQIAPGNQKLSYDFPVHLVRGEKHFLYGADGTRYLDAYNNVPHVGHAHPHVTEAVSKQMSLLNTNTRYLQDVHVEYAERMVALLPDPLSKIVFLNSGSEANEFALRLVRAYTGRKDMIVMEHGYHGNTTGAMDISPYKFNHPMGAGAAPPWVHVSSQPDVYRGRFRGPQAPAKYITDFDETLKDLDAGRRLVAGFISECVPSVGGQIVLPDGYLKEIYAKVRNVGGVCIGDDVQTAFGRLGNEMWGYEQQGVVPDIAVLGKPMGNGFPLAAVAMTNDIADAFEHNPEFFSTFGGNSVACAAGNAVLDVLKDEKLQFNAKRVGSTLLEGLGELQSRHAIIGDIRGSGLFLGIDLVTSHGKRQAASEQANYIKNRMRESNVLLGVEGPDDNVLKIRPPMTFDQAAADQLLSVLDVVLSEDDAQV